MFFVVVGEHWKGKGKSQPSFHMGEFNGWDFTYVRGSCEWAIHRWRWGLWRPLTSQASHLTLILTIYYGWFAYISR